MSYKINAEMLGDATNEQAMKMVEMLNELGYDVEFTRDCGLINGTTPECPVPDDVWIELLGKL